MAFARHAFVIVVPAHLLRWRRASVLARCRSTAAGSVVDDDCHLLAEARVRPRLLGLGRGMETSLKRFLEHSGAPRGQDTMSAAYRMALT